MVNLILKYFNSKKLLSSFVILPIVFTIGCESNNGLDFFSQNNKQKEEQVQEDIPKNIKKTSKNPSLPIDETVAENEKEINLSNIRQIGQARKDESKIISFFFDLFDDDEKINESEQAKSSLKNTEKLKEADKNLPSNLTDKSGNDKINRQTNLKKEKKDFSKSLKKFPEKSSKKTSEKFPKQKRNENQYNNYVTKKIEEGIDLESIEKKKDEVAFFRKKEVIKKEKEKIVDPEFLKIGMLLPLTGEKKAAGDLVMNSLRYSISNKQTNLIFKIYDTKGHPEGAVDAAKTGLNEGIKIFIGPIFSDETRALNKDLSREDALFFSLSPDFSNVSDNVVVSGENPIDQISCINRNLIKNDLSRVLIIYPNNKYGEVIRKGFSELNINMQQKIKIEYFELSNSMNLNDEIKVLSKFESRKLRLKEEIQKVKNNGNLDKSEKNFQVKNLEKQLTLDVPFDAVVIASQGDKLLEVLSHLAFYDINSQNTFIYGTSLWEDTDRYDKVFEGAFFVTSLKSETESFRKDFKNIFSKEPLSFNFYIYDLIDFVSQYQRLEKASEIFNGEFSNSKINSGLMRRETFIKKVLRNNKVINISSCSLNEL